MRVFFCFFFCLGWSYNCVCQIHYRIQELDSICQTYQKAEQFIKGTVYAKQLVEETKNNKDTVYVKALLTLARFQEKGAEYHFAEENCHKALAILEESIGKYNLYYANGLELLGNIYYASGRSQQAELQFLEAKNIYEHTVGKKHKTYGSILGSLGGIYLVNGKLEEAEPLMLEALKLTAKHYGKDHETYGLFLNNLAILYEHLGDITKARKMALEALEIRKKALGIHHLGYTHTLSEVARLYFRYGDPEKAEPLLLEVFETRRQLFGYQNKYTLGAINKLGVVNYYKQDYLKGLEYAKLAFNINGGGKVDTSSWESLFIDIAAVDYLSFDLMSRNFQLTEHLLAKLHQGTKDEKWLTCLYQLYCAQNRINSKVRNSFRSEEDKLKLTQQNVWLAKKGIATALKLDCPDCMSKAFLFAEENKSRLLSEALRTQQAQTFGNIPEDLAAEEKKLQTRLSKIKMQLAEMDAKGEGIDTLIAALNKTNKDISQFQNVLETSYAKYYKMKYDNELLSLEDLQNVLEENQVLIEYFVTKEQTYAFFITKNLIDVVEVAVSNELLNKQIKTLRTGLSDYRLLNENYEKGSLTYIKNAHWFYEKLLEPILEHPSLTTMDQMIIVADGELGHLPFESFLTELPDTNHQHAYQKLPYLLKKYEVSYSYSAALWLENQYDLTSSFYEGKLLAYAGNYNPRIAYNKPSRFLPRSLSKLRSKLADLPAAEDEVLSLAEFFSGTFKTKETATEHHFKQDVKNHDIIHLAMHGVLNPKHPILSALVFTETGDTLEDNFLQAYEISQMDMNAQLVVLSACETGFGQFKKGEGIMSLARSFMYAGVPSLVVSLWQVNDLSTAVIMESFYRNLSKGQRKNKALQEAKLDYIQEARGIATHPAFWAPFIQLGNSEPIVLYEKSNRWIQGIWIGLVVLIGLIMSKLYSARAK